MTRLVGRGAAPGVGIGRAVVALRQASHVRYRLAARGTDRERQRLRTARERTRLELEEISSRVARTIGDAQASIFAAQLLMLDDPLLVRRADDLVRTERINAEWALERALGELQGMLALEGDAWVRERVGDIADVSERMQRNLRYGQDPLVQLVQQLEAPLVLVVDALPPSVAAQLDWSKILGLVTDVGGPTNHTVILVRSLGVPIVVGLSGITQLVPPGQIVALDGATGEVVIDPSGENIDRWTQQATAAAAGLRALDELRDRPAVTADGLRVHLYANLEIADEVARVRDAGAEGIGLYRSEFLLDALHGNGASEDAQVVVYRSLLEAMHPQPVTIRTFDAGEDRLSLTSRGGSQRDRFGFRGIRGALQQDDRFCTQIRALLRAADSGCLRILLPFVTSAEELVLARRIIADIARDLDSRASVPIGAMIEVPAAALTVDALAAQCDFLSVGTNDLIQYTLAVDRTDERLAGHYEPASPAILRLLHGISVGARRARRELLVCGEMAADPLLVGLLVGLGFRAFSMTPASIPLVKRGLLVLDSREATAVARRALRATSALAIERLLAPLTDAMQQAAEMSIKEHS
ncbi:MAG: phosphoenolpyruvate--protein phosphotransferase [Vicinamibacterales bacterium]